MKKIILTLSFILITNVFFSQEFEFIRGRYLGARISSIAVDNTGNKWLGTSKSGLTKYDDKTFTNFNYRNSKIGHLVRAVYNDSEGRIWSSYSVSDGIVCIKGSSKTYYTKDKVKNLLRFISVIDEDNKGNIYFGGSGLIKYNGSSWINIRLPKGIGHINAIDISTKGKMAVVSNEGIFIKEGNTWKSFTRENSDISSSPISVKFNTAGVLFIGYRAFNGGGFSIYDKGNWKYFNKSNTVLLDYTVNDIEIDKNGVVWFATNDGLFKYEDQKVIQVEINNGKSKFYVTDIAIEGEIIWLVGGMKLVKMTY